MQVLYLDRAPCTKETLPDFLKWFRVTRHPFVFRGLTGSQRTPGFGASQEEKGSKAIRVQLIIHSTRHGTNLTAIELDSVSIFQTTS